MRHMTHTKHKKLQQRAFRISETYYTDKYTSVRQNRRYYGKINQARRSKIMNTEENLHIY
jgi:hypothetical protein